MSRHSGGGSFFRSRWGIGALAVLAIIGLLLVFDHWSHIAESELGLPALIVAWIGMHFFMHGGHGGHGRGDDR